MANLVKTDEIESALGSAGIDPASDEAVAVREAVAGGEDLKVAIEAFAPTPSALATSQPVAAPVVAKGEKKGLEAPKPLEAPTMGLGSVVKAHEAGLVVGRQAVEPLMQAYQGGVAEGVSRAMEGSQASVAGFLQNTVGDIDAFFISVARSSD